MKNSRAFSLIEVMISVLIGAILMYVVTNLLFSGMRTSSKGTANLSIIQANGILMGQLEEDLRRAVTIDFPLGNAKDVTAKFDILERNPAGELATATIMYQVGPQGAGILRKHDTGDGTPEEHPFCRGFLVQPTFCHLDLPEGRKGFWVRLETHTTKDYDGEEAYAIERFFACPNFASNTRSPGWNWSWY